MHKYTIDTVLRCGCGTSRGNSRAWPRCSPNRERCRERLLAAAHAIAERAELGSVVPSPLDAEVHQEVRRAAAKKAREQGLEDTARLS